MAERHLATIGRTNLVELRAPKDSHSRRTLNVRFWPAGDQVGGHEIEAEEFRLHFPTAFGTAAHLYAAPDGVALPLRIFMYQHFKVGLPSPAPFLTEVRGVVSVVAGTTGDEPTVAVYLPKSRPVFLPESIRIGNQSVDIEFSLGSI